MTACIKKVPMRYAAQPSRAAFANVGQKRAWAALGRERYSATLCSVLPFVDLPLQCCAEMSMSSI